MCVRACACVREREKERERKCACRSQPDNLKIASLSTQLGSVQAGLELNASLGQALHRELSRQSESGATAAE